MWKVGVPDDRQKSSSPASDDPHHTPLLSSVANTLSPKTSTWQPPQWPQERGRSRRFPSSPLFFRLSSPTLSTLPRIRGVGEISSDHYPTTVGREMWGSATVARTKRKQDHSRDVAPPREVVPSAWTAFGGNVCADSALASKAWIPDCNLGDIYEACDVTL